MVSTSNVLIIAAGVTALLALLIFITAVATARRGQKAAYYSVRRDAQRAANRSLQLSFLAVLLAGGLYGVSMIVPRDGVPQSPLVMPTQLLAQAPTPEVTSPPTLEPAPTLSPTAVPTLPPSPTPTLPSTPTPRATPIPEPTSTLISATATADTTSGQQSPLATPGPAAPNKRLTLLAIAAGVDANGAPVDAGTAFTAGVKSIYIFFDFRDVPPSALLRHSWFRNGGSVYYLSQRFPGKGATGTTLVRWAPRSGLRVGLYEVRVQLGGVQQFVANFEVK